MSSVENMQMVLTALKNAGLNDNQARILAAEIGRENSFQDKYLWGYHVDPKNGAKNIGIISWQGSRAKGVERALKEAGLIQNGKIVKGQAALDVMAKYLVNEIRTVPSYKETKTQFLDNPNVDYNTGARVLGRNYIQWRYDDANYAQGHKNRDAFYAKLGGIIPNNTQQNYASVPNNTPPFAVNQPIISPMPQIQNNPTDLFANVGGSGLANINLDMMSVLNDIQQEQIQAAPILGYLPTTFI